VAVANALVRLMRSMRVVRRFAEKDVPDEVLDDMLEVARWTGTSKNTQPWHLVVVRDRESLRRIAKLGQFAGHIAGANVAIALVMESKNNAFDCGRLAERLMLAAWSHGVGSCIGSIWPDGNERAAKELLGVPTDRWMHQVISFGYPADAGATRVSATPDAARILPSVGRRTVSDLVSWERFGNKR
jgi:nitroreductase